MTMGGWKFREAFGFLRSMHPQMGDFDDDYGLMHAVEAAYQDFRGVARPNESEQARAG